MKYIFVLFLITISSNFLFSQEDSLLRHAKELFYNKQHDESNKVLFTLIESYQKKQKYNKLAEVYYFIASNFDENNFYDKSIIYIDKSIDFGLKSMDSVLLSKSYSVKSGIFLSMYNFEMAQTYIEKALKYVDKDNIDVYFITLFSKSNILLSLENYQKSIDVLFELEEFCLKNKMFNKLDGVYYNLGLCYEYLGNYNKSLTFYRKALEYVEMEDDMAFNESLILAGVMLAHAHLGNADSVDIYYNKYLLFYEKEVEARKSKELLDIEAKYQTVKKEKLIAKQKERIAKMDARAARKSLYFTLIISVVTILALVFLAIAILQRQKRKVKELEIQRKNKELEELVLSQESKTYKAQLSGEIMERKRIASELHDRLGGLLATINLNLTDIENVPSDELRKKNVFIRGLLRTSIEEVRGISHNLYNSGSSVGFKTNLEQLAEGLNLSGKINFELHYEIHDLVISELIINELFKVVQELVTNTLKHAKAENIELQISRINNELQVIYEDDGIGMVRNNKENGLGLKNIQDRIQRCNGVVIFDSVQNRGTTVVINIPI